MQPPIATLTMNPAVDTGTRVDQVLAGRKLRCAPPRREPGGGGINVARVVRRLGGEATAVFPCGGSQGGLLRRLLEAEGLPQLAVPVAGETRNNLTVTEESSGRQFRFGLPGPELSEAEQQACLEAVRGLDPPPSWLVLSGSLPPGVPEDFYARLVRLARDSGTRVVLDTSGAALRRSLEEGGVHLAKPNLREFGGLIGEDWQEEVEDERRIEEAARAMVRRGWCRLLVISLGAGGALLASEDRVLRFRAPAVPVRSRIGAGDSMTAGLVYRLARGGSAADAVRYGVAAGAAAVMTPGTELSRREDTERLYGLVGAGQ